MEDQNEIEIALLEAIYIWRGDRCVLTVEESEKMVKDIFKELDEAGYKIVKK